MSCKKTLLPNKILMLVFPPYLCQYKQAFLIKIFPFSFQTSRNQTSFVRRRRPRPQRRLRGSLLPLVLGLPFAPELGGGGGDLDLGGGGNDTAAMARAGAEAQVALTLWANFIHSG